MALRRSPSKRPSAATYRHAAMPLLPVYRSNYSADAKRHTRATAHKNHGGRFSETIKLGHPAPRLFSTTRAPFLNFRFPSGSLELHSPLPLAPLRAYFDAHIGGIGPDPLTWLDTSSTTSFLPFYFVTLLVADAGFRPWRRTDSNQPLAPPTHPHGSHNSAAI